MARTRTYDVVVVGGGIGGSTLAGVLARAGLGVLLVEKEARFRDRIRGETTWPYGVADALRLGLGPLLHAESVSLCSIRRYEDRVLVNNYPWAPDSIDGVPEIGFSHPGLQEAAFAWAEAQGATAIRPAKVIDFALSASPTVTVEQDETGVEYTARLIVGADGKRSAARRWAGGASITDPEHHRMGGVLLSGVRMDRGCDHYVATGGIGVNWFPAGRDLTRLYLVMPGDRLRETTADRSFEALISFASGYMPEGTLDQARQEGPIGFFPNSDTWSSCLAGNGVVLIGDAAGAPDPTQGHGTALLFHDVRTLSEWLLAERDWARATAEYAARRQRYYDAVLQYDRWRNLLREVGPEADRRREGHERAKEADPLLGGFALIEARGPDGLVADEAMRRRYFGEFAA